MPANGPPGPRVGANSIMLTSASTFADVARSGWSDMARRASVAKIVSWGIAGCDPDIMGIGPVPATHIALEKAGMKLDQMDLIEVNEAFAGQILAVAKDLGIDQSKLNVNGGAIALGHPLGATGARLLLTLSYELRRRGARFGLATACIGGGQGIAMILENPAA